MNAMDHLTLVPMDHLALGHNTCGEASVPLELHTFPPACRSLFFFRFRRDPDEKLHSFKVSRRDPDDHPTRPAGPAYAGSPRLS